MIPTYDNVFELISFMKMPDNMGILPVFGKATERYLALDYDFEFTLRRNDNKVWLFTCKKTEKYLECTLRESGLVIGSIQIRFGTETSPEEIIARLLNIGCGY